MRNQASFWTSLPGILTGIAAVIAASVGLVKALEPAGSQPVTAPARTAESPRAAPASASITLPRQGRPPGLSTTTGPGVAEPRPSCFLLRPYALASSRSAAFMTLTRFLCARS